MTRAVLFDLDGTLIDRDAGVRALVEAQRQAFARELVHVPPAAYLDRFLALDAHGHGDKTVVYQQLAPAVSPKSDLTEIPEGIRRSRAALRRDLPELLSRRRYRGKWVCYHLEERIGIGSDYAALIGECNRRNIPDGEYTIERITPNAGNEEEIEIDTPFV